MQLALALPAPEVSKLFVVVVREVVVVNSVVVVVPATFRKTASCGKYKQKYDQIFSAIKV